MIYKTLHWYILKELLRIFLLTACALTTLLAFGGTFKPLTKEGLDVLQLLNVMANLMPAMVAYAIPLAALFAAVLVYWRVATDNEITACRSSGISYMALVAPALMLGILVSATDLVFVHYVVPSFLQRTERLIRKDISSLLIKYIERQEPFPFGKMVVYADSASLIKVPDAPAPGVQRRIVHLQGMAAAPQRDGRHSPIVLAQSGNVIIDQIVSRDEVQVIVQLQDGAAFDPTNFRKIGGTVNYLPPNGEPFIIGSVVKDKPKFLNFNQLADFQQQPELFQPVAEAIKGLITLDQFQCISKKIAQDWKPGRPILFRQNSEETIQVRADKLEISEDHHLRLVQPAGGNPVKVEHLSGGRVTYFYTARIAELVVGDEDPTNGTGLLGTLLLRGDVALTNLITHTGPTSAGIELVIRPLQLPESLIPLRPQAQEVLAGKVGDPQSPEIRQRQSDIAHQVLYLMRHILSENQSRMSFAVSCLALVLIGAALGILLKGRNPLAVFVVGFVPAILLVLLITAGRKMIETSLGHPVPGLVMIWAGNVILMALVGFIYNRLLRQ